MKTIDFETAKGFSYHWCGMFVPPGEDWIHMSRNLRDYELMVVTEGTLHIGSDLEEFDVSEGEYLIMPPTVYQHGTGRGACSFYWVHFDYDGEKNDALLSDGGSYVQGHITMPVYGKISSPERVILLIKQLMDSDRRYREVSLNNLLTGVVLAEIAASSGEYRDYGRQVKGEQTFNDIKDYISWHIHEPLKVGQLAEYFGYNEKYITTFFRSRAGISLKQYILLEKIDKAKALLSETAEPISLIAYGLGWTDAHNFANAFKKIAGLSPGMFRESYNKRNVFNK